MSSSLREQGIHPNMPHFGKTTPLLPKHFAAFEQRFGNDPNGKDEREEDDESGRFRCFSRDQLAEREWNLDISWLRDDVPKEKEHSKEPKELAAEILVGLRSAMSEVESVVDELSDSSEIQS